MTIRMRTGSAVLALLDLFSMAKPSDPLWDQSSFDAQNPLIALSLLLLNYSY